MGWVVSATPRPLYPWERPGTHCIGAWMGPSAGLDGCGKSRPPSGIRLPDRPARSESLYRLGYPGPSTPNNQEQIWSVTDFLHKVTQRKANCSLPTVNVLETCSILLKRLIFWPISQEFPRHVAFIKLPTHVSGSSHRF